MGQGKGKGARQRGPSEGGEGQKEAEQGGPIRPMLHEPHGRERGEGSAAARASDGLSSI